MRAASSFFCRSCCWVRVRNPGSCAIPNHGRAARENRPVEIPIAGRVADPGHRLLVVALPCRRDAMRLRFLTGRRAELEGITTRFRLVRRISLPKPHQLVLGVGVLASLGALASGGVPRLTGWEDDSPVSRRVFDNVPDPLYWAFYTIVAVMLLVVAWLISQRVQNYERGLPDDRRTTRKNVERRLAGFRSGVWMQT